MEAEYGHGQVGQDPSVGVGVEDGQMGRGSGGDGQVGGTPAEMG